MLDPNFVDEISHNTLNRGFVNEFRCEICAARIMLKSIDLASRILSFSRIEMSRQAEILYYRQRGFMPSKGKV